MLDFLLNHLLFREKFVFSDVIKRLRSLRVVVLPGWIMSSMLLTPFFLPSLQLSSSGFKNTLRRLFHVVNISALLAINRFAKRIQIVENGSCFVSDFNAMAQSHWTTWLRTLGFLARKAVVVSNTAPERQKSFAVSKMLTAQDLFRLWRANIAVMIKPLYRVSIKSLYNLKKLLKS